MDELDPKWTEPPVGPQQWILRRVKSTKMLMWVNPDTREWVPTRTTFVRENGTVADEGKVRVKGGYWLDLRTGKVSRRKPKKVTKRFPRTTLGLSKRRWMTSIGKKAV